MAGEKELLENFILNNDELEQLETLLSKFNIFDALDLVRHEIRHSNFLAWILNPRESHGLGDYVLKKFLAKLTYLANPRKLIGLSLIDIDAGNFEGAVVERERLNIDILISDERNKLVCAIENKIDSNEHSDQLRRYKESIDSLYPGYHKLFIYLTVEGQLASHEGYLSISYLDVCDIIDNAISLKGNAINSEVRIFILHYLDIVRSVFGIIIGSQF